MPTELPNGLKEIPEIRKNEGDTLTFHVDLNNGEKDIIRLESDLNQNSFFFFDRDEDVVQAGASVKDENIAITSSRIGSYVYLLGDVATSLLKGYSSIEEYCPGWDCNAEAIVPFIRRPQNISDTNVLLALENTNASAEDLAEQITGRPSKELKGWRDYIGGTLWDKHGGPTTTLLIEGAESYANSPVNNGGSVYNEPITQPSKFRVKNVDKITGFKPTTDSLEIDTNSFDIEGSPTFAAGKNRKTVKKKLAKQDFDFLYDQKKGGLYFNANGADKGFGEGGIIAILKGAPDLTSDNLEFL